MGSRCLFVTLVSGWRRLPVPPASTTPFIGLSASFRAQSLLTAPAFFVPGITVGPALSRPPLTVARRKQRNGCVSLASAGGPADDRAGDSNRPHGVPAILVSEEEKNGHSLWNSR